MKPILLLHGVNLNRLGLREARHYGHCTLKEIETLTAKYAKKYGYDIICFQSNHEGEIVDQLQAAIETCSGIIINPGAFTHYSYAIHDALLDTNLPAIEVHLSDISQREPWRQHSVTSAACIKTISGQKEQGYITAVKHLVEYLQHD